MDIQAIQKMRRLYRSDPLFHRALQDDPTAALTRWGLEGSETAVALAGPLRALLSRSPEETLTAVLRIDPPVWDGVPPEPIVAG